MSVIINSSMGFTCPAPQGGITFSPFGNGTLGQKKILDRAMWILENNLRGCKSCNDGFEAIGGNSFDEILKDGWTWITYSKNSFSTVKGHNIFALTVGNCTTITELGFSLGVWSLAATLVYEFAIVNGNLHNTHQALKALRSCGMHKLDDPRRNR
jgi:hypothetical protein